MIPEKTSSWIWTIGVAIGLAACGGLPTAVPPEDTVATLVAQTLDSLTAEAPPPTAEPIEATEVPPEPAPEPAPTEDDTPADWPQYRTTDLGYSIRFPPNWDVWTIEELVHFLSRGTYGGGTEPFTYLVYVAVHDNPGALAFEDLITADYSLGLAAIFSYTVDTIGPYTVYITQDVPSRSGVLAYFFEGDGEFVEVTFSPYEGDSPYPGQEENFVFFEKMLTTLEFGP